MRCNICNRVLSPREIVLDTKTKKYKPCSNCLDEVHKTIAEDIINEHFPMLTEKD